MKKKCSVFITLICCEFVGQQDVQQAEQHRDMSKCRGIVVGSGFIMDSFQPLCYISVASIS